MKMREAISWGLITGTVSAAVAALGDWLSSSTAVSLFPDLLSLIALVAVASVVLRRVMAGAANAADARRRGVVFGVVVAAILALATLVRGLVGWSSFDVVLASVTVVGSFAIVVLIVAVLVRLPQIAQRESGQRG